MRAVLFDLDGTLTDSAVGIMRCIEHALVELGHPGIGPTQLRACVGPPLHDTFAALGLDPHAAVDAYRDRYVPIGMFENEVYAGIVEVLDALAGTPLLIASSKPEVYVRQITAHFGIDAHFIEQVGANFDGTRTDKTEIVGEALRRVGIDGGPDVAMVGDRIHDVIGARANGCTPIGAGWGYAELGELAGVTVAQTPAELMSLLV